MVTHILPGGLRYLTRSQPPGEVQLDDYHPAFHVTDAHHGEDAEAAPPDRDSSGVTSATAAVEDAITLLVLLGWPAGTARAAVEHVCVALTRVGNRHTAYETLSVLPREVVNG
ncbi:hypothetical protein FAM23877_05715 [Propionibacterium freudenreichii]|uniref:hypothetical protein n=1 Tax=Propionibacterium freudenreichii TaxID=1744 RepID=UPI002485C842|nr:hypothetical protein [Propionibacterium freudenreichii]WGU91380.1 hypothetical protein FAM23877_05715 [Propionibacterium freudenreichii]